MKTILFLTLFSATAFSQNWLKISAGYLTGHALHELGHLIVNEQTGTPYTFDGSFRSVTTNKKDARHIACAGFCSEIITSEIALLGDNNDYKTGIILHSIINPLGYILREKFFNNGGDIDSFKKYGGNAKILRAVLVSHAVITAIRLHTKSNSVIPYVTYNQVGVVFEL